jgi:hypothetical protein
MRCTKLLVLLAALLIWKGPSHAAEPLPLPLPSPKGAVVLTVSGNIEQMNAPGEAQFDMAMLEALGWASFRTTSEVSDKPQLFEGVPLRAVLERVGAQGKNMKASALNDYEIVIPIEDLQFDPIIATRVDGRVLTMRDKGPLWIVYPRDAHKVLEHVKYDARWVWQLNRLHIR